MTTTATTVPRKYLTDSGDRLLEHYAEEYTELYPQQAPDLAHGRMLVDSHPGMQGLLGRGGGALAYEKALVVAGIATDEEKALVAADSEVTIATALARGADERTRGVVNDAVAQTVEAAKPQVGAYEWEGEVKNIPASRGYDLLARYRQAARALHVAKEEAKAIEQEIMEELGGYEHGAVDGQQLFHWPVVDSTSFNAKEFKADAKRKALYDAFLVTKQTRRFSVNGTVGVD